MTNCIEKSAYLIKGYENKFLCMTSAHLTQFDNDTSIDSPAAITALSCFPLAGFVLFTNNSPANNTADARRATSLFTEATLEAAHTFARFVDFGADIDIGRRQCHPAQWHWHRGQLRGSSDFPKVQP